MARFVKSDIVVVSFPFSDFTQSKRRPALVLAELSGDDRILCQITSQNICDKYSIEIVNEDFEYGSLRQKSNIRPNRIFTCDSRIILYQVGCLKLDRVNEAIEKLIGLLRS